MKTRVLAVAAHADDIEFGMAGTLILLADAGCEIHTMNIGNGSCGSAMHDANTISALRLEEATDATACVGGTLHPPLVPDIDILYEKDLLAKLGSIMREVAPHILLVPSPNDYMEDHTISCRLAVTAAFCRGMRNYPVDPPRDPVQTEITIYHAQPHGNRDSLNRPVMPDLFVNITSVIEKKADMLACHKSQKDWLDKSQGMNAYINTMKQFSREMGLWSGKCEFAEGWRRHNPLGLCASGADPIAHLIGHLILPRDRIS